MCTVCFLIVRGGLEPPPFFLGPGLFFLYCFFVMFSDFVLFFSFSLFFIFFSFSLFFIFLVFFFFWKGKITTKNVTRLCTRQNV